MKVDNSFDIPYLVFLAELIHILDPEKEPSFETSVYTACDMFGGREQRWALSTGAMSIKRTIYSEMSESGQRIEDHENTCVITGLPKGLRINWNGDFTDLMGRFRISVSGIDEEQTNRIKEVADILFYKVTAKTRAVKRQAVTRSRASRAPAQSKKLGHE